MLNFQKFEDISKKADDDGDDSDDIDIDWARDCGHLISRCWPRSLTLSHFLSHYHDCDDYDFGNDDDILSDNDNHDDASLKL